MVSKQYTVHHAIESQRAGDGRCDSAFRYNLRFFPRRVISLIEQAGSCTYSMSRHEECNMRFNYYNEKVTSTITYTSHKHLQRMTIIYILTLAQFTKIRIKRYHRICSTEIQRVVDTPVDLERRTSGERRRGADDRARRTSRTLRAGWNKPWSV